MLLLQTSNNSEFSDFPTIFVEAKKLGSLIFARSWAREARVSNRLRARDCSLQQLDCNFHGLSQQVSWTPNIIDLEVWVERLDQPSMKDCWCWKWKGFGSHIKLKWSFTSAVFDSSTKAICLVFMNRLKVSCKDFVYTMSVAFENGIKECRFYTMPENFVSVSKMTKPMDKVCNSAILQILLEESGDQVLCRCQGRTRSIREVWQTSELLAWVWLPETGQVNTMLPLYTERLLGHTRSSFLKMKQGVQACANPKLFLGPWGRGFHCQVFICYVVDFFHFLEFSVEYCLLISCSSYYLLWIQPICQWYTSIFLRGVSSQRSIETLVYYFDPFVNHVTSLTLVGKSPAWTSALLFISCLIIIA